MRELSCEERLLPPALCLWNMKSDGFSFTISCDWSMVISFPGFFSCNSFLRVGNFSGPKYTNVSLSNMVSAMSYEQWAHSSSPRKRNPESLSFCCCPFLMVQNLSVHPLSCLPWFSLRYKQASGLRKSTSSRMQHCLGSKRWVAEEAEAEHR